MCIPEADIRKVIANFSIEGTLISITANKEGHINSTFFSTFNDRGSIKKYTHQKINTQIFRNPIKLMKNISLVTNHIRSKIVSLYDDTEQRCLHVIPTHSGSPVFVDRDGSYWRTYRYIDKVRTYKTIENERQAYLLGEAIGMFQLQLADFDGRQLYETIPHFHDMANRYTQLEEALQINYQGRLDLVKTELDFLLKNRERGCLIWDKLKDESLPLRVTHNDTKMNNVLFSQDGQEALCVIDLDTVMPGTILFDTGDMIRTATTTAEEDATDLSLVQCDIHLHRALLEGYFSKATFLTPLERSLVVESGRTITQIMAVRFLTDFLNGDTYYHTEHQHHNLDRARNQIALMQDMDRKWEILLQGV